MCGRIIEELLRMQPTIYGFLQFEYVSPREGECLSPWVAFNFLKVHHKDAFALFSAEPDFPHPQKEGESDSANN